MSELEQALKRDKCAKVCFGSQFAVLRFLPTSDDTVYLEVSGATLATISKSWKLDRWRARFLPFKPEIPATSEGFKTVYEILEMLDGKREWRKDPEV